MIDIDYLNIDEVSYSKDFENFCFIAYKMCGGDHGRDLSITLTNDSTIKLVNHTYRKKNEATDVLSFAFDDAIDGWPVVDEKPLGQIIISIETLKINAIYFKVTQEDELKRLVIHGILHLMGYDHQTNEPTEAMLLKQEAILKECYHCRIII